MVSLLVLQARSPARIYSHLTPTNSTFTKLRTQQRSMFNSFPNSFLASALGTPAIRHLSHTKSLPYPPNIVFQTVSDVAAYPKFVPFTESSDITSTDKRGYPTRARLKVGYANFDLQEVWDSVVRCNPEAGVIEARSCNTNSDGLFEVLRTKWTIQPEKKNTQGNQTSVKLDVDVQFRNPIYDQMFAQFESTIASSMIAAFEKRVAELYRKKKSGPEV